MTTDQQTIQDFIDALFESADMIELRFLPPLKSKSNQWFVWPGEVSYDFESIADRNKKQDAYFGVNPR